MCAAPLFKRLKRTPDEVRSSDNALMHQPDINLDFLVANVKDYQLTHGSLLKNVNQEQHHTVQARPIGVSLIPGRFPRALFDEAVHIQPIFNELYAKVASDEAWFQKNLSDFLQQDEFGSILWDIYLQSRLGPNQLPQPLSLGVFRSDYMLDTSFAFTESESPLKQVEFNTFSCAGATHANIVADMHRHLHRIGAYGTMLGEPQSEPTVLPRNHARKGIVNGLIAAHKAYNATSATGERMTGILIVVQPHNTNIADERPLEYDLWDQNIPTYRLMFGSDSLSQTSIGPSGELLFNDTSRSISTLEISVVYLRAGYQPQEYDDAGYAGRLRFEQSKAIKAPSVLSHLTTFKKVQQQLAEPGALNEFLDEKRRLRVWRTFMSFYPLDASKEGELGRVLALKDNSARLHVLKPSLEGGGNNVYGEDIPAFLAKLPKEEWGNYILMSMIKSPTQEGKLMSFRGLYEGPVRSELGMLGTCLWRTGENPEILHNEQIGWTFKSKAETVNEMSVVKGYGCFDSPWLVDTFEASANIQIIEHQ